MNRFLLLLAFGASLTPAPTEAMVPMSFQIPTEDTATVERPVGLAAVEALEFPSLDFAPPEALEYEVSGVHVFHLEDPSLPLVDVQLFLRGGISNFPRDRLGTISALPYALRNGGTLALPPDSVDRRIDLLALQVGVGQGGGGISLSLNALTHRVDAGLELLQEMLLEPRFDPEVVEVWRIRELERFRRREDNPGSLAFSEFNRLMYGDHPIGWVLAEDDLVPDRLSTETLRESHAGIVCRDRLIVGISGDLTWDEAEERIRRFVEPWPECEHELPDPPRPELREDRGVFVLPKELDQSTIVMAGPSGIQQDDTQEYFASRVANYLLGGRGFNSRILARIRTEEGLTYGAASVWTTPRRSDGIAGAFTATRADRTIQVARLLLEILEEFRRSPPQQREIDEAVEEIANGYVFAFESPAQIVSRRMVFRAQGLPDGWLERYLEGLREVTAEHVQTAVRDHLHPERMTILIVGDPDQIDSGLATLGPVFELTAAGEFHPRVDPGSDPDANPRSPR